MKITLHKPQYLNEKGKRDNNEDSIYPMPSEATVNDRLFLVCDGVGGLDKGEIASRMACDYFALYFMDNPVQNSNKVLSEAEVLNAFKYVQQQFDAHFEIQPESKGMATTLTLLYITNESIIIAHCGDSRVYHIRGNQILFCTEDHTPVNDLLKQGIITPEEAAEQPKSSKISRAIQGNSVQRTKPDVKKISDIQTGDYFMLSTDGVHGSISDFELTEILSANQTEQEKTDTIRELCEANSHDNYSMYLLKINNIEKKNETQNKFLNNITKFIKKNI